MEIVAVSEFKIPVLIQQISSSDTRFMPVVRNTVISPTNKTTIIDLNFDPGQSTNIQSFSLAVKAKADPYTTDGRSEKNAEIWQRATNMEEQAQALSNKQMGIKISQANFSNYTQLVAEALSVVSGDDIALWRSKKQKSKEIYSKSDAEILEQIEAKLTIKTNIVDQIEVPVRGYITEPKILHTKEIDFGEV